MRNTVLWAIATSCILSSFVGCQSHPSVIRGQSPAEGRAYYDPAVIPASHDGLYGEDLYGEYKKGLYVAPYCVPEQWHRIKYTVPQGLVYPPPNAQPGVYMYPYYTVKGPDCFFYAGE